MKAQQIRVNVQDLVIWQSSISHVPHFVFTFLFHRNTFRKKKWDDRESRGLSLFWCSFLKKQDERWRHPTVRCPRSCWCWHFYCWHDRRVCLTAGYETHTLLYFNALECRKCGMHSLIIFVSTTATWLTPTCILIITPKLDYQQSGNSPS